MSSGAPNCLGEGLARSTVKTSLQLVLTLTLGPLGSLAKRQIRDRVRLAETTGDSNPRYDHMEFDPVLAELEQEQDDVMWRRRHEGGEGDHPYLDEASMARLTAEAEAAVEESLLETELGGEDDFGHVMDYMDTEDYSNYVGFNITERIIQLFPLLDANPKDNRVSLEELTAWHLRLGQEGSWHRTRREMETSDGDKDERVTLQEALSGQGFGDPSDESSEGIRQTYTERFHAADLDNDSLLNLTEFHDFLHPEESENAKLHHGLVAEEMRRRDLDGDGKINLNEYEMTTHHEMGHLFGDQPEPHEALAAHFEANHDEDFQRAGEDFADEVQRGFNKLDTNKDGFIEQDELTPIAKRLWPSQRDFATSHAKDLLDQADMDDDKFLTLEEMLKQPHAFYETVDEDGEEEEPLHDEF